MVNLGCTIPRTKYPTCMQSALFESGMDHLSNLRTWRCRQCHLCCRFAPARTPRTETWGWWARQRAPLENSACPRCASERRWAEKMGLVIVLQNLANLVNLPSWTSGLTKWRFSPLSHPKSTLRQILKVQFTPVSTYSYHKSVLIILFEKE